MATVQRCLVLFLWFATCQLCFSSSSSSVFSSNSGRLSAVESQFARHRTIRPAVYHGREKRQLQHTHQQDGHVNDVSIVYSLDNDSYILDLRLHKELLPESYFEKYHRNGEEIVRRSNGTAGGGQLCHYQGKVRHVPLSWVALSTCGGLSGVIFDGNELLYIEPRSRNSSSLADEHLLMKHSDLTANFTCGTHSALPHSSHDHSRMKRQLGPHPIGGPFKSNSRSRYVELVLVVDNKSYENQDKDLKRVFRRCKDIANIVNALYAPLNIFVALVGIVVWSEKDEIQISVKGDETLTNFLHYRRVRLSKEHPNDNAQLLTGIQFQGGVVGKALKGPMCTYEFSGGVAMDHSPTVGLVATTVAHEMGHNFGMEHDNDSLCHCPDDKCIMAASSSSVSPSHWSSCSLENLALSFEHGMDYCLRNKPTALFESPECGNMFVEEGEECDCGLPGRCDNPCCNPATCKLHVNATCATGECCDITTCRLKNAGLLCRSALQECDLPEYCTGTSEYCPKDFYKMDGISCGQDKAYCYEGSCRSHSDQCRLLWGPSGKGSDAQCYKQNTHGNKTGNCGYQKFSETFTKCRDENINCGLLHCSHLNERLEFGMESVAVLSHSFFNVEGKIIPCRTANVDLGLQDVDPGLVPNGAKCGTNKMCVNQNCVAVSSVFKTDCPRKCNSNGECNNLGQCHCKVGFAPPYCDYPGPGGSLDGGPASDPNVKNHFVLAMFVIFLGIVPTLALVFCGWYCCRDRRQRQQLWAKIQGAPKLSLPTRGSPDFTQPPSSSNSSTTSSPSRRIQYQRRFFWPISLWVNKFSAGSRPVPADDASSNLQRNNGSNGIKVEISRPMPLRPTKLGGLGSTHGVRTATSNNTSVSTTAATSDRPTSSLLAQNLVGNGFGFTLSPLTEQADSSFDSFDSADTATEVNVVPSVEQKSSALKEANAAGSGIVAARANFFSANAVASKGNAVSSTSTLSVPVRPAPTVPVQSVVRKNKAAASGSPTRNSVALPVGHTEIVITKTVVPVDNPDQVTVIKEVITSRQNTSPAHKSRPLSTPNAYSVKAIFNKGDQQRQQAPNSTDAAPASNTTTLQRMAALFKPSPLQIVAVHLPPELATNATSVGSVATNSDSSVVAAGNQSIKAAKINRESLRNLEISNPIPQKIELPSKVVPVRPAPAPPPPPTSPSKMGISTTLPRLPKSSKVHFADDEGENQQIQVEHSKTDRPIVERSESMRLRGVTNRPNIPQFGSMRHKRPLSVPFARPTSPPPNPPSAKAISPLIENDYPEYDDCSKATAEDANIYASIEELQADVVDAGPLLSKRDDAGSTTTSNSDGLLSEIVSELKKKNLDEVYSVGSSSPKPSTLASGTPRPVDETLSKSIQNRILIVTNAASSLGNSSRETITTPATSKPGNVSSIAAAKSTTTSAASSTPQTYKPYSSSSALRNRYLGGTSTSIPTTSSSILNSSARIPLLASSKTTPTPTMTTFSSQSTSPIVSSIAANPLKKEAATAGSNSESGRTTGPKLPGASKESTLSTATNPIPLPQQPPVGKISGSNPPAISKPLSTFGKPLNDSKRPLSPDRNPPKPNVTFSSTAAKPKLQTNSKALGPQLANKAPAATNLKSSSSSATSAPKVTKPVQNSQRSAPAVTTSPITTTSLSSSLPSTAKSSATSPSYSVSTSSPGAANSVVSSGKHPSASIVQSMHQKFDASKPNKFSNHGNDIGSSVSQTGKISKLNSK